MFGFLFHRKREEVQRILHGRMNRTYLQTLDNKDRHGSRGAFCEVVWVIPVDGDTQQPDYSRVQTLVTRDISANGLSLIHNRPIGARRIIVGLRDETYPRFIACNLEHCTALGYGFYLIGLRPEEVVVVTPDDVEAMDEILRQQAEELTLA
jgi:hypothetical protein